MDTFLQNLPTYSGLGVVAVLLISLLRMRSDEIKQMGRRISALEGDNRLCLIVQQRLIRVIRVNGLDIPEGTFDVTEVMRDATETSDEGQRGSDRNRRGGGFLRGR